ncbi:MAG: hypothetical protein ACK5M3_12270 [Dysgonomonas sp.]
MRKIVFIICLLFSVLSINSQSLTKFAIRIDQRILNEGAHVQINLPKTPLATIEYFIDVYAEGGKATVEAAGMGAPKLSYSSRYTGEYLEITMNNFVVVEYGTAGQVYWNDGEYRSCSWYFNDTWIDYGNYNLYPYGSSSVLTVKLD